jgi:hypothetical protein
MSLTAEFLQSTHGLRQVDMGNRGEIPASPIPAYPTLENVLARFLPLPEDGLFLGVASDGLPVLLNLSDPRPGGLLVLGDKQTGKTDFLQGVARAASMAHPASVLRFVAVTPHLQEWEGWNDFPRAQGLWAPDDPALKDVLNDLSTQAQQEKTPATILLLVDDLQYLEDADQQIRENLRWLVTNGAAGRVWTIATLNAGLASSLPLWVRDFGTRIYGRVGDPDLADRLATMPGANLRTLLSGAQFCIREKSHWLRFWLPL